MTEVKQQQIVHESEAQRQHVRLPIPAVVEIDGVTYATKDLSSGGISVLDVKGSYTQGQNISLRLVLPFKNFSLDTVVDAEVLYANAAEGILGCQFVALDAEQLSLINHALKAFMVGDLVSAGDILSVAGRDNFVKQRKAAVKIEGGMDMKKSVAGVAVFLVLGVAALAFIGSNVYSSLFTVKSADAYVSGPVVDVRAPSAGVFKSELAADVVTVQPGQVMASINGVKVSSPCDCYISEHSHLDGDVIATGDKLVSLVPVNAQPWVIANVDTALSTRIGPNNRVVVSVAGSDVEYTGSVSDIKAGATVGTAVADTAYFPKPAQVKIVLDQKLPVDTVNRPASVVFSLR